MKHQSAWAVRVRCAALLLLVAASVAPAAEAPPASYVYHTIGDRKLQMEAHYPPGWKVQDKRPAVLLFSGAHKVRKDASGKLPPTAAERARLGMPAANNGPGTHMSPLADHFAKEGLICFRVGYRTRNADGVRPGEDVADAVHAIRWVRSNAAKLGVDPNRVAAAGGSSGAYLAAGLFALNDFFPKDEGANVSARPDAIMLYSPLVDWLKVGSMTDSFLEVLEGDKELGAKVSPARHWRKQEMPPTLVMVGSNEPPFETVREFAQKWQAEKAPMELFIADGGDHGFYQRPEWLPKTFARSDEFLKAHGFLSDPSAPKAAKQAAAADGPAADSFVYKKIGQRKLQLAMHYPPGWTKQDKRPAMLLIQGGGENPKDKSGKPYPTAAERAKLDMPVVNEGPGGGLTAQAEYFASRGMVCAQVEYRKRKTDGTTPADAVADAGSAIRWVRANADRLGIDPRRVVASGVSSGGHLCASLAALEGFDDPNDDRSISRRPDALILQSPLMDFLEGGTAATQFIAALDGDRALGEKLSPARHWSKEMPPTLLFTGKKEPVYDALCEFGKKWKAAGQNIELIAGEGGHGYSNNEKFLGETLPRMEAFLKSIGFLDAGLAVAGAPLPDAPRTSLPATRPVATTQKVFVKSDDPRDPAWIVNGKNKIPKLQRLLGSTENVRVVVRDLQGKQVAVIEDVFSKHTDLNRVVGKGEYRIEFFDKDGKQIVLTQEVGEILNLK